MTVYLAFDYVKGRGKYRDYLGSIHFTRAETFAAGQSPLHEGANLIAGNLQLIVEDRMPTSAFPLRLRLVQIIPVIPFIGAQLPMINREDPVHQRT